MSKLYSDAILEAKRLREVAEANAKKQLIEAITPKIRNLIDRQLMGESIDDVTDEDIMSEVAGCEEMDEADDTKDKGEGKDKDDKEDDEELLLSQEGEKALKTLKQEVKSAQPAIDVKQLERDLNSAKQKLSLVKEIVSGGRFKSKKERSLVESMLRKVISISDKLSETVIRTQNEKSAELPQHLSEQIKKFKQEIRQMGKSRIVEEKDEEILGASDEETSAPPIDDAAPDMDMDAGDEDIEIEGEGETAEIPVDLAQQLLAALEADLEPEDEGELVSDDDDEDEGEEEEEEDEDDEVVEIDEGLLKRELHRMKRASALRESKKSVHDPAVLDDFGGGKVEREPFVDSDDSDLNVLENRRLRRALQAEVRKNRALAEKLNSLEKKIPKLREQMEALNLLNAKLLYVNKMMTNEQISARQRQAFVTALDKAQNLREVKLLYRTVTDHVGKRTDRSLTESSSRRAVQSSSRTVSSSASRLTESAEPQLERWAILAGISDKETK